MALFDKEELIDVIRHEMLVEEDHNSIRVFAPVRKRAKYGGLPLNFRDRMGQSPSDIEDQDFNTYEVPLYQEPIGTKNIIESRLRSRTVDSDNGQTDIFEIDNASSNHLFVGRSILDIPVLPPGFKSPIAKFLEENPPSLYNPLNEFSRYEAVGDAPSRKILILVPTEEHPEGEDMYKLDICVHATAKVAQVIGYCCYLYYQKTEEALGGVPTDYNLLMAEDSGDIYTDFPPLDNARTIGELGFSVLALVRTRRPDDIKTIHVITVYFTNGTSYEFELESLDASLTWLKEETLKRKFADDELDESIRSGLFKIKEYSLEAVDVFDVPLNQNLSISSSGYTEFVMVRRNSSRGDFHPRGRNRANLLQKQYSTFLSPSTPGLNDSRFDFSSIHDDASSPRSVKSPSFEESIYSYVVERLHRYKPKWTANMDLRWNCIEISPTVTSVEKRRTLISLAVLKTNSIPWENVGDVKLTERKQGNDSLSYIITISWLPVLDENLVTSTLGEQDQMNLHHVAKLYETLHWKIVQVQMKNKEEANGAYNHIMSVVKNRDSACHQAYCHSLDGARRPHLAADIALMESPSGPILTSPTGSKKKGRFAKLARLTKALNIKERSQTAGTLHD